MGRGNRPYQGRQSLRDDLPRPLDQAVDDRADRLDPADQAHVVTRQQVHRYVLRSQTASGQEGAGLRAHT